MLGVMTTPEASNAVDDYRWIEHPWLETYCVIGIRGITIEEAFRRWHAPWGDHPVLEPDDADREASARQMCAISVAAIGEWIVGIDRWSPTGAQHFDELAAGTEAWSLCRYGDGLCVFEYRRGSENSWFEPPIPSLRGGTDPDRFVQPMAEVGLLPQPEDGPVPASAAATLRLVSLVFGVKVTTSVLGGRHPIAFVRPR